MCAFDFIACNFLCTVPLCSWLISCFITRRNGLSSTKPAHQRYMFGKSAFKIDTLTVTTRSLNNKVITISHPYLTELSESTVHFLNRPLFHSKRPHEKFQTTFFKRFLYSTGICFTQDAHLSVTVLLLFSPQGN